MSAPSRASGRDNQFSINAVRERGPRVENLDSLRLVVRIMKSPARNARPPNLHVIHSRDVGGPEIDALTESLRSLSSEVLVTVEEPKIYAGYGEHVNAAVSLFVAKALLEGFLKEIGAGAARTLRPALLAAYRKAKSTGSWLMSGRAVRDSQGEVEETVESMAARGAGDRIGRLRAPLEIVIDLPHGVLARFVLPSELDEVQFGQAVDEMNQALSFAIAAGQGRAGLLGDSSQSHDDVNSDSTHDGANQGRRASYIYDTRVQSWRDAHEMLLDEIRRRREARANPQHGAQDVEHD